METSELNLELLLLKEFKSYGKMAWTFLTELGTEKKNDFWTLESGAVVASYEYRMLIRILRSQGLIQALRCPAGEWLRNPGRQKSITVYQLTAAGRELLKELGL